MAKTTLPLRHRYTPATFADRQADTLSQCNVPVPTGEASFNSRLTLACHAWAIDYGYSHWAQPYKDTDRGPEEWLVFAGSSFRLRTFLKRFPTREAAEMWLLHHE